MCSFFLSLSYLYIITTFLSYNFVITTMDLNPKPKKENDYGCKNFEYENLYSFPSKIYQN